MAQILAKVLKNIRMMHRAGLTACPQALDPGLAHDKCRSCQQLSAARHNRVPQCCSAAILSVGHFEGLSWHTLLVCMAVVFGGGA